jgi:hypothetical protein
VNRIVVLLVACSAALINTSLAASTADGLQEIEVKGIDTAHAAPGATLAAYSKLRIEPVSVAFHKDFKPVRLGSQAKLDARELDAIRVSVAKLVRGEFTESLQRGSCAIVEEQGPDVLQVRAGIIDLIVNAPDTLEAGRNQSFTMSTGEMTLELELIDAATGQAIFRARDREEAWETGRLNWTTRVTNESDARLVVQDWTRILRDRLAAGGTCK